MGETSEPIDHLPASDTKERAAIENADAQEANEADTRCGEAGIEAKPCGDAGVNSVTDHTSDAHMAPDKPRDLVSGRRNAGRDDASDADGRPPHRSRA